ncbi:TonB family protein [Halieaceae bacterium IMCC14734]|uniref:TonB family protein n=2 Tax=Candidatus Litorirhabdus singularis TaxID=2518993 RepID=A0ABT3TBV1_9GAMM|nr:TonB family protein [Candidatus Litorirhabdus singularis]
MTMNWSSRSQVTEPTVLVPKHIQARLIDAEMLKPKKVKKAAAPPAKRVVASKPVAKPKAATVKSKPKPVPKVAPKPEPVVVPQPAQPSAEERRAAARDELSQALAAEDVLLEEASDRDIASSYVSLISQTVQNNWSRPPSARNGMEAELIIQLVPTGEVVSVTIARSSGHMAFDRSAVNAVQKAGRFEELQQMPPRIFERSFRQFRLLFKPEDLRY